MATLFHQLLTSLHQLVIALAKIYGAHFRDIRGKTETDAKKLGMDCQKLLGHP